MYLEEQRTKALHTYYRIGSVTKTIRLLGYPIRQQMYRWILEEKQGKVPRKHSMLVNIQEHPRNPLVEVKMSAIRRYFEKGESVKSVSEEVGYSRTSIYLA